MRPFLTASACATGIVGSIVSTVALTKRWIRASSFPAPQLLREPFQTEILQCLRQRLAGLPVVADFAVPRLDHLVPLGHHRLALGGAVHRRGAVTRGRPLHVGRESAAQGHRAVDGGGAPTEADGLVERVDPAGGGAERTADVLQPRARREDADAERVLEVAAA